jgi:hypothetical protein
MKKVIIYLFAVITISITSCKGNSSGQTGGAQADSGTAGSSGVTDSSAMSAGSGSPTPVGTSGTDTSGNGKGTTNPIADTVKTNP